MSASRLIDIARNLSDDLKGLSFSPPVFTVYDPTEYAFELFSLYVDKFGKGPKKVVLVGMNPGPWGMIQTGVPFGEVRFVRDWMGIEGKVGEPACRHPKRPVYGFECDRSEVSGGRLWGWARGRYGDAGLFFKDFFVLNYCPLAFFDDPGRNITPDRLAAADRRILYALCDCALKDSVAALTPETVVGVGKFAYERSSSALDGMGVRVGRITHPSPANPAANRGWEGIIEREMKEMGIEIP